LKKRAIRISVGLGLTITVAVLSGLALHRRPVDAAPTEADWASERLRVFEAERHRGTDFSKLVPWSASSGPDPYLIRSVPGSSRLVGILRGDDALVVLDASLHEIQRLATPASPTALAVADDGSVFAAGELSPIVARFDWKDGALVPSGTLDLGSVRAIRGIATGPNGWIYVVEEHDGLLIALKFERGAKTEPQARRSEIRMGTGPAAIERTGDRLIVNCVLDHALLIQKLDPSGKPAAEPPIRIVHDGPLWSFAASPTPGGLLLAVGGVEDHPLDRTVGAFGYVDSFLYLYGVDFGRKEAVRQAAVNLSELGVVTPKALTLQASPARVTVTGYGSDQRVDLEFSEDRSLPPQTKARRVVPGTSSVAVLAEGALAFADPLLDAWVLDAPGRELDVVPSGAPAAASERDPLVRLGEALFFTTLMGPWNKSDGPLSRFTCETCHFEGYVDGRTHHTGRGDIHAVTKPLLGLFNNRPHFSRALDPDLVAVAFNEFRVAGAKSGHDPWFALSLADAPWLARLNPHEASFSPEVLRKALMAFLMTFNHRPNPMAFGRAHWSADESAGAMVFRDRCESCHEARLVSDEPSSRIAFDRWEELVMTPSGPIVWGKAEYKKTGIVPYVHDNGARVPSLRRLYKKRPYFTNGSARTLEEVLARARFIPVDVGRAASGASAEGFWHEAPGGDALDERARAALLRFLDLL
jgi:hypothetical protein